MDASQAYGHVLGTEHTKTLGSFLGQLTSTEESVRDKTTASATAVDSIHREEEILVDKPCTALFHVGDIGSPDVVDVYACHLTVRVGALVHDVGTKRSTRTEQRVHEDAFSVGVQMVTRGWFVHVSAQVVLLEEIKAA